MANVNVDLTLDEAVAEVLGLLTGLDMTYDDYFDRYRAIARQLNRALRNNALEHEWSYYSDEESVGTAHSGDQEVALRATVRARIIGDDSVRFCDSNGNARYWAYILPRDALSKYINQPGLYASVTRAKIDFNRPFGSALEGLEIRVPVMREPRMFDLPPAPKNTTDAVVPVPQAVKDQLVDFDYPDIIIARAAFQYAQTDPVMQPRVQTLEAAYKDLGYGLVERDDRNTDAPFLNEFFVPISNSPGGSSRGGHRHPHSDERR